MTNASKKQNRILLGTLVVLFAALITLVALTSSANRKAKAETEEKTPLPDSRVTESAAADDGKSGAPKTGDGNAKTTGKTGDDGAKPEAETEILEEQVKSTGKENGDKTKDTEDAAVSATVKAEDMLPVFRLPVEGGVVVKGCSLTVPVFSATMNDYRVHQGLDFACAPGTPVFAAADGVVTEVRRDPMMGVTVAIRHNGGAVSAYKGLDEQTGDISHVGDKVAAGQVIGAAGETALIESAEENHMHFELEVNGRIVDPGEYLPVVYLNDLYED